MVGDCRFAMTILSAFVGYARLDLGQAISDVLRGERSLPALVLVQLRLPRALLGCFVEFSLGMTGAAMQGLLRNPLAEPGVIEFRVRPPSGQSLRSILGCRAPFRSRFRLAALPARFWRRSCSMGWSGAARGR